MPSSPGKNPRRRSSRVAMSIMFRGLDPRAACDKDPVREHALEPVACRYAFASRSRCGVALASHHATSLLRNDVVGVHAQQVELQLQGLRIDRLDVGIAKAEDDVGHAEVL